MTSYTTKPSNEMIKTEYNPRSPGNSLMLYTESTTDVMLCTDTIAEQQTLPEDLATKTTHQLLGGCMFNSKIFV